MAQLGQYSDVTLTAGDDITIVHARKIKIGKLVSYAVEFTASAQIALRSVCVSGLEAPIYNAAGYWNVYGMLTSSAALYQFAVYSQSVGQLRNMAALPAGTYRVGVTYMAQ